MRRALFLALALAVLPSCSSDTPTPPEPTTFSGDYRLESINGQSLPFIDLFAPFTGDTLFITAGDLHVLSRGRLRLVFHRQWRPRNAPPQPVTTDTLVREYRMEGDFVYIDHPTGGLEGPYVDTVEVYDNALMLRQLVNRYNLGHFWRDVYFVSS